MKREIKYFPEKIKYVKINKRTNMTNKYDKEIKIGDKVKLWIPGGRIGKNINSLFPTSNYFKIVAVLALNREFTIKDFPNKNNYFNIFMGDIKEVEYDET